MTSRFSADRLMPPAVQIAHVAFAFVDHHMQTMTMRTTIVAGALIGSLVPLVQMSYEQPLLGLAVAAIAPTPAARKLFRKVAGLNNHQ